ncbi:MAG: C40 family peptidase [bacterium]|nr:C40 family peptidase [bacterium]
MTTLLLLTILVSTPGQEALESHGQTASLQPAIDQAISRRDSIISHAENYLEFEYRWNGRDTNKNPDMDCMGLCFLAYAQTFHESWAGYSVYPSELIETEQLGSRAPLSSTEINDKIINELHRGDIIYFLYSADIFPEPIPGSPDQPIDVLGESYEVIHMGLYHGDGNILHASPWKGHVTIEPLANFEGIPIMATRKD